MARLNRRMARIILCVQVNGLAGSDQCMIEIVISAYVPLIDLLSHVRAGGVPQPVTPAKVNTPIGVAVSPRAGIAPSGAGSSAPRNLIALNTERPHFQCIFDGLPMGGGAASRTVSKMPRSFARKR